MSLIALFLLFFGGGPLMFWALIRREPSRRSVQMLGVFVGVFVLAGLALRYGVIAIMGPSALIVAGSVLMMWFAWIGGLAFGAQALRRADTGAAMRRWSGMIGAVGTTVPWFGLASARWFGV